MMSFVVQTLRFMTAMLNKKPNSEKPNPKKPQPQLPQPHLKEAVVVAGTRNAPNVLARRVKVASNSSVI